MGSTLAELIECETHQDLSADIKFSVASAFETAEMCKLTFAPHVAICANNSTRKQDALKQDYCAGERSLQVKKRLIPNGSDACLIPNGSDGPVVQGRLGRVHEAGGRHHGAPDADGHGYHPHQQCDVSGGTAPLPEGVPGPDPVYPAGAGVGAGPWGVESTLAVIGTGGPVPRVHSGGAQRGVSAERQRGHGGGLCGEADRTGGLEGEAEPVQHAAAGDYRLVRGGGR
eukprot:713842-Pyramimonas_sp.AAC.1